MTEQERIDALAAALLSEFERMPVEFGLSIAEIAEECAAALLDALPPDWCGHEATIARLREALMRFGTHGRVPYSRDADGTEHGLWLCNGDPCRCGLAAALAKPESEPYHTEAYGPSPDTAALAPYPSSGYDPRVNMTPEERAALARPEAER